MLNVRASSLFRFARHNLINQKLLHTSSSHGDAQDVKSSTAVDTSSHQSGTGSISKTVGQKLPKREPLVKNFFVGQVDKELLGYPEVITRDDMKKLQDEVLPLKNYFENEVDTTEMDTKGTMAPEVVENIKSLGLYGINVPEDFDGKGWNFSESLIASEPESICIDVALALLSHRVIIDVINELGTDEQKNKFLSKLGNGSLVGAEAIFEYNAPADDYFNTHAYHNRETNSWTLNGEKAYVITNPTPKDANTLFLVIAQTNRPQLKGDDSRATTIFLVDSASTSDIELGEVHQTIGGRNIQMRRVKFNQVHVPEDCVLGTAHDGNLVADTVLRSSRLRTSMIGLGMAKNILNNATQYCVHNKQCGVLLKDMEIMQTHLSSATCNIYATESMIYMTAGLLDEFDEQDVALEAALTKYFTLTHLLELATKSMHIVGPKSLHAGERTETYFRNVLQLYTQGESIDTLCLFNALTGLQHAGMLTQDTVRKSRNPLFHPGHIFSRLLQGSTIDNPRSKMRLGEVVHPSLEPAAQCIEHSVLRLQMCTEMLLTRYGNTVVERHCEMRRLSDMATILYSMFASTSRASRSYCIGLQLADHEMLLATAICLHGRDFIKNLSTDIFNGQYVNNDNNLRRLSGQIVKSKGYFPVHPLTFNY